MSMYRAPVIVSKPAPAASPSTPVLSPAADRLQQIISPFAAIQKAEPSSRPAGTPPASLPVCLSPPPLHPSMRPSPTLSSALPAPPLPPPLPANSPMRCPSPSPAPLSASRAVPALSSSPQPSCRQSVNPPLDGPPVLSRAITAPSPAQPQRRVSMTVSSPPPPPPPLIEEPPPPPVCSKGEDPTSAASILSRLKRSSSRRSIDTSASSLAQRGCTPSALSLPMPRSPSSATSSFSSQSDDAAQSLSPVSNAGKCRSRGCWMDSEIDGMCIQHFYAAEVMEKGAQGWRPDREEKVKTPSKGGQTSTAAAGNSFTFSNTTAALQPVPLVPAPPAACSSAASAGKSHAELLLAELVQTECSYLTSLTQAINSFLLRLRVSASLSRPLLSEEEIHTVFTNIETIHSTNLTLYTELCGLVSSSPSSSLLSADCASVLSRYAERAKCYTAYVCGYDDGCKLLVERRRSSKELDWFLRVSELCDRCRLEDLLIQPVQRIPRYLLLLRSLLQRLTAGSPLHAAFSSALTSLSSLTSAINSSLHLKLSYRRVSLIAARLVDPPFPISLPQRQHLLDGCLLKKYNNMSVLKLGTAWKRYWFVLFNDLLLYAAPETGKVKHVLWLDMMRVRQMEEPETGRQSCIEVLSNVKSVVVQCETDRDRERWLQTLREAIDIAVREKRERRRDIDSTPSSSSCSSLGEVKRGSAVFASSHQLCAVDDDDDEDDESFDTGLVMTPSPLSQTPQRRYTAPTGSLSPTPTPQGRTTGFSVPALMKS